MKIKSNGGFTLVELLVVIIILGILIAIAVPSFLGVREKAKKAGVESNVNVAFHNAKAEWVENEAYPGQDALATSLAAAEPGIDFEAIGTTASTTAAGIVGVNVDTSTDTLNLTGYYNGEVYKLTDDGVSAVSRGWVNGD